jgi:hypothetical protein
VVQIDIGLNSKCFSHFPFLPLTVTCFCRSFHLTTNERWTFLSFVTCKQFIFHPAMSSPLRTIVDSVEATAEKDKTETSGMETLETGAIELQGAKRDAMNVGKAQESSAAEKETIAVVSPPPPPPSERSGKPDSFSQLVRTWEAYINDDEGDVFQPLQMLQSLQLCSRAGEGLARLAGPSFPGMNVLAPPALQHTSSSPLQYRPPMFDYNDEELIPPPIPLNPFQRSSSTPSAYRTNSVSSAFGTADRSAFTLPSQRSNYASGGETGSHFSAFDPVKYYATALDDMERTSIEVMDMSTELKEDSEEGKEEPKLVKKGAASRAARFLTDVRTLRRRRRMRGGRENPAQPASVSSGSTEGSSVGGNKAAVTIITESNYTPRKAPEEIFESKTVESQDEMGEPVYSPEVHESDPEDGKDEDTPVIGQYHQLDSDVDEEESHYQRIEASLHPESPGTSPGTVPSPSYEQIVEDSPSSNTEKRVKVDGSTIRIQVSNSITSSSTKIETSGEPVGTVVPLSPTRKAQGEGSSINPSSDDSGTASPGTTRSSNTGSTSGHTTQAASIYSSGQQSTLSTISETDREVMEANKQGKMRLSSRIFPVAEKCDADGTSLHSSSTDSSNPAGYVALDESPTALREGANVPADRFFINSPEVAGGASQAGAVSMRSRTTSTSKKSENSPVTIEGSSGTNTSSSHSSDEEPPTFVSYLQRQAASDLTSVREAAEASSPRAGESDGEEREGSPAEIVGYPTVLFEQANVPKEQQPMTVRPLKQNLLDKYRSSSRPPRSPVKGARPVTTPPPRGSVSPIYNQHSPPRNIVDHPDSNLSRPYVMRTGPAGGKLVPVHENSTPVFLSPVPESDKGVPLDTAEDVTQDPGSIEVLKNDSDSEEELTGANIVTPEKELNA